jgi:hypothetical protein
LTAEEIGLSLDEAKQVRADLQRLVLQTQMEEYTESAVRAQFQSRITQNLIEFHMDELLMCRIIAKGKAPIFGGVRDERGL